MDDLIRSGLSGAQKTLPSALFYDDLGSALFDAITFLPEYEVTRAGTRLLQAHREAIVASTGELEVVELGPGTGRKARILLEALLQRQPGVRFFAVDVSAQALQDCQRSLEQLRGVRVETVQGTYLDGLQQAALRRGHGARRLVLFLGSNLSNFDRQEAPQFLRDVRQRLLPGDRLLLATDLDKPAAQLLPAYDDALGVTAAFDKNALLRLNRDYGADFDLGNFVHEARWNVEHRRIEMHLRARAACTVQVPRLELTVEFAAGESIWTESSHRFLPQELRDFAAVAGYRCVDQWIDAAWPFAQTLMEAI